MILFKKSIILLISNIIAILLNTLIIILLNKLYTSIEVGVYFLNLAITAPIFLFLNLDLRRVVILDQKNIKFYIATRFILNIVATILSIIIFTIFNKYSIEYNLFFIVLTFYRLVENLSEFTYGLFQKEEQEIHILYSKTLRLIFFILFLNIIIILHLNIIWFSLILLISSIITFIIIDIKSFKFKQIIELKSIFKKDKILMVIKSNWYLGVSSSLVSLSTNLPIYFIESFLGTAMVGIFSSIRYIITGFIIVASSIGYAMLKKISILIKNKYKIIWFTIKIEIITSVIGTIVFLISFILHKKIIVLLYNNEVTNYSYLLTPLLFAGIISILAAYLNHILLSFNIKKELMYIRITKIIAIVILLLFYKFFMIVNINDIVYIIIASNFLEFICMIYIFIKIIRRNNENNVF